MLKTCSQTQTQHVEDGAVFVYPKRRLVPKTQRFSRCSCEDSRSTPKRAPCSNPPVSAGAKAATGPAHPGIPGTWVLLSKYLDTLDLMPGLWSCEFCHQNTETDARRNGVASTWQLCALRRGRAHDIHIPSNIREEALENARNSFLEGIDRARRTAA